MSDKHTPGPWRCKVVSGFDYGSKMYWLPGICTNVTTKANARLIAAAPDLLEVLKAIISDGMHCDVVPHLHEKARAAIAKAEASK